MVRATRAEVLLVLGLVPGWRTAVQPASGQTAPQSPASVQDTNDRFEKQLQAQIAGHEGEPAGKVFKNVQWLKDVSAGTLLGIMDGGYSKALGVTCTHCHVETDFASDEKRPKKAARDMQVLHRSVNDQLTKMQNLAIEVDKRYINCATCHRGHVDPRTPERRGTLTRARAARAPVPGN